MRISSLYTVPVNPGLLTTLNRQPATRLVFRFTWGLILSTALSACYGLRPSQGGAEAETTVRKINTHDIALPAGYQIEAIARGLTFPTGITIDEAGEIYVVESGYSYGETWTTPRLLKVDRNGGTTMIASGEKNGPWNGVTYHDGSFFISEGGQMDGGKILKISADGKVEPLIKDLPSTGDHHTNGPAIHDGYIYFGQGTATNSGVVGEDNASFGWLKRNPDFHDIPCKDIVLRGKNYDTKNVMTDGRDDVASTGAFVPFNTKTSAGQVIKGELPCSGAVMRIPVSGGPVELVAWGFRNPFGLAFKEGRLFVADNGYDERGSRPVWGTGDILWEVNEGAWYGWPDYSGHHKLDHSGFRIPGKETAELLLQNPPDTPPHPAAILGVHSSSNGLDFSTSNAFGFTGYAFIAQLGDMAPNVGKVLAPVGFKIVVVNPQNGVIRDFAVNKGRKNGPASVLKKGGLERPVDVQFSRDGSELYIVDFGILEIDGKNTISHKGTGVIWKISKK